MAEYLNHPTMQYSDGSPVIVLAEKGAFIERESLTFEQAKLYRRSQRRHKKLGELPLSMWPKMKAQRFSFASSGKGAE